MTDKCLVILSTKCSGSSAIQNLLAGVADVRHVSTTRHFQNETLYWTKAASLLGRPQDRMLDSEVPIPADRARADLVELLTANVPGVDHSVWDVAGNDELVFDGWRQLIAAHQPVFIEKSPHHLPQWSSLELLAESMERMSGVDVQVVGLVRNPLDTLFSAFRRWRTRPEQLQLEWLRAYGNLRRLQDLIGSKLVIVRYEDVVQSTAALSEVAAFCGIDAAQLDDDHLHASSLNRWRENPLFGFALNAEVRDLAMTFGYDDHDLANPRSPLWPAYREGSRVVVQTGRSVRARLQGVSR